MEVGKEGKLLPGDIFNNPDFYLYQLDLEQRTALFVEMDRESYGRSSFLDSRIVTSQDRKSTRLNSSHTDISRMPSSA